MAYIEEAPSTLANIFSTPYSNPAWGGGSCEFTQEQIGNIATNGLLMPKVYVKREYTKAGMIQSVSLKPKRGFHLHSAFYNDKGQEVKEGILFATGGDKICSLAQSLGYTGQVDHDSNNIIRFKFNQMQDCLDYINNHSSSTGGWHICNYPEYCLLAIFLTMLKNSSFIPNRYNSEYILPGLKIGKHGENEFSFHTLSKKTGEHVDTGKVIGEDIPIHSWLINSTKFLNDVTEDYDLRDLFVSKDKSKLMFEKLYGDQVTMDYVATGEDNGNMAKLFSGRNYGVKNAGNCHKVQLEDGSWKYNTYSKFDSSLGNSTPTYVANQKWNYLINDSTNTFNVSNSIKPTKESYGTGSTIASYFSYQDITFFGVGDGSEGYFGIVKYI